MNPEAYAQRTRALNQAHVRSTAQKATDCARDLRVGAKLKRCAKCAGAAQMPSEKGSGLWHSRHV
eukprot:4099386-Prymnesium_polylepis.1